MSADRFYLTPSVLGLPVVQSSLCTRPPTPREDATRIVRHGLADVLDWLQQPVGPAAGEPVPTAYIIGDRTLMAHPAIVARIAKAAAVVK